jgi:hypothetical protein
MFYNYLFTTFFQIKLFSLLSPKFSSIILLSSKLKQTKMSFFFFYKIREQEQVLPGVPVRWGGHGEKM